MGLRLEYRPGADLEKVDVDSLYTADCNGGIFDFNENMRATVAEAIELARQSAMAPLRKRVWALRITFSREH